MSLAVVPSQSFQYATNHEENAVTASYPDPAIGPG